MAQTNATNNPYLDPVLMNMMQQFGPAKNEQYLQLHGVQSALKNKKQITQQQSDQISFMPPSIQPNGHMNQSTINQVNGYSNNHANSQVCINR